MAASDPEVDDRLLDPLPATDYGVFVNQVLARQSNVSNLIDQKLLRQCMGYASSFLISDTASDIECGISTWYTGLARLVDLVVALHNRNELELDTIDAASQACSECWTAAGQWRSLSNCRVHIREVAGKLKNILDANGRTYQGKRVYAP